jgi:hypothetical protein
VTDSCCQKLKSVPAVDPDCLGPFGAFVLNTSFSGDGDFVAADGNKSCGDGKSATSCTVTQTCFFCGLLAGVGPSGWPFGRFIFLSSSRAVAPDTEIETSTHWIAGLGAWNVKSTPWARSAGFFEGAILLLSMSKMLSLVNILGDICAGLSVI